MFEFTALFVYKLQFMLELLIAELLFCWKLKRKNHFYIRLIVSILVSFLLAFLIPIISYDSIYVSLLPMSSTCLIKCPNGGIDHKCKFDVPVNVGWNCEKGRENQRNVVFRFVI